MKHARPPFYCPALVGLITLLIYCNMVPSSMSWEIYLFWNRDILFGAYVVDIDRNYSIK